MWELDVDPTCRVSQCRRILEGKPVGKCEREVCGEAVAGTDVVDTLNLWKMPLKKEVKSLWIAPPMCDN